MAFSYFRIPEFRELFLNLLKPELNPNLSDKINLILLNWKNDFFDHLKTHSNYSNNIMILEKAIENNCLDKLFNS